MQAVPRLLLCFILHLWDGCTLAARWPSFPLTFDLLQENFVPLSQRFTRRPLLEQSPFKGALLDTACRLRDDFLGCKARPIRRLTSGFYSNSGNFDRFQLFAPFGRLLRLTPRLIELNNPFAGAIQVIPFRDVYPVFPRQHPLITFEQ